MKTMTAKEFDALIDAIAAVDVSVCELHPCGDCGDWDDENEVQTGCRGGQHCVDDNWARKQFARINNIEIIN